MTKENYYNETIHNAEALCMVCSNVDNEIIKLRYERTVLNPEEIKIFYCHRCRKEYHEYNVIWSNYEWLYREELKEWGEVY